MSVVQTLIGNVKGPQGATGATGATGPQGDAATITVGSVSTTAYGNPAQVVNVGTENEAILNFVIPQGRPGQATTTMGGLTLDTITTSTADFPSPQVGDTGATAFGKIVKFFADALSALNSKLNAANVVNNLTTTEAGYALDARAGKTLNDSLASSLATTVRYKSTTVSMPSISANSGTTIEINNWSDASPYMIQFLDSSQARPLIPTNWWINGTKLSVQVTNTSSNISDAKSVSMRTLIANS